MTRRTDELCTKCAGLTSGQAVCPHCGHNNRRPTVDELTCREVVVDEGTGETAQVPDFVVG